ncbi:phage replisome organizer N-terminal domain-containing protein [Clostridium folliculivorans]|uniref:Phage replisome organiser N-terminal domain-containing protein n=1 Tax=Clostridium folliculivorans TaxID=2886038 RepID=A0A9W5Y577_9CLOT|nr:phage replisome organizer N-terminal domain-containing protein [Clostridium folliculivorans]GKU26800.1 hypothetical protein CFOLD11_36270 [Clostridium folliculivorans]GKU31394.1 hypothetical protein CFB3_35010 [Clostridium folliculivorans]
MRERKYVKFRVDMYEDTKFKIIDMKPERDVIHYIWNRLVLLAGKVNLEGDMFLSKNIPYTIETLAIEFNRDASQIKLALEVFIELEMIELSDSNIYRVKNFAKHQNIKAKKKEISKSSETAEVKNAAVQLNEGCSDEVQVIKPEGFDGQAVDSEEKNKGKYDYKDSENITADTEDYENDNVEILENNNKDIVAVNGGIEDSTDRGNLLEYNVNTTESRKRIKRNKKKKGTSRAENIDEIASCDEIIDDIEECVIDGIRPLGKDEISIVEWSFG